VFQSFVDVFEAIRFFADAFDQVNLDVPTLKQSNCLAVTNIPKRIGAFRLWMKLVLGYDVTICLDPSRPW
jgi:hypothetical protein